MAEPFLYRLMETDLIPTPVIRWGIRRMLAQKIQENTRATEEAQQQAVMNFVDELRQSPIAIETDTANEQHYEIPTAFYDAVLGPRKKYSSGYWGPGVTTLAQAEEAMLDLCCQRADIEDGQSILDLGCGWGSMTLWLAEHYPHCQITALSNSTTQRQYIESVCREKGFTNVEVMTANVVDVELDRRFDRVMSIEMFEHMKNYEALLEKISRWLTPDGALFIHIFTHHTFTYHYDASDPSDWLTRYFFAGGTMPSDHLLFYFQKHMQMEAHWRVDGTHYEKTANAWWDNMKRHRREVMDMIRDTYGAHQQTRWWVYWKVFFLACAELWGYRGGREWFVSHYKMVPQPHLMVSTPSHASAAMAQV